MSGLSSETVVRTAREGWECEGDGAAPPLRADECSIKIEPGDDYAEYLGESPAYASGSRHCMACARDFGYVEEGTR